jgi:hypothetical protein
MNTIGPTEKISSKLMATPFKKASVIPNYFVDRGTDEHPFPLQVVGRFVEKRFPLVQYFSF